MISLRAYTRQDSDQLSKAINQVCANTPWMSTTSFVPTDAWRHAMYQDDCHHHQLLVAEANGEVVGWCRSFPAACDPLSSRAELGIGLLARYRNQGIGSKLVLRSLEWADSVGLRTVDLIVTVQNSIAIHVFQKCGFEPVQLQDTRMMMSICLS